MIEDLKEKILNEIGTTRQSSTGFYTLKCPICNDYKVRAGFKFETDKIIYNCFRGKCDASTVYEEGRGLSRKFRQLLEALSIDIPVDLRLKKKPKAFENLDNELYKEFSYKPAKLPENIEVFDPDKHVAFAKYLQKRHANFKTKLYVGKKGKWKNRLIVPFKVNGRLIGWQGISLTGQRYLKSEHSELMFVNNEHGYIVDEPIIVEGVMDAVVIPNSVAILSNKITKEQAYFFRNKKPILVPDRTYSKFFDIAKRYGWRISIPDWDAKDINEAVIKYGLFVTARKIHEGIEQNIFKAETKYELWKQ